MHNFSLNSTMEYIYIYKLVHNIFTIKESTKEILRHNRVDPKQQKSSSGCTSQVQLHNDLQFKLCDNKRPTHAIKCFLLTYQRWGTSLTSKWKNA